MRMGSGSNDMQKLWIYDDAQNWGRALLDTARKDGYFDAHLFEEISQPDEGYLFFHMHHHPQVRARHKYMMGQFALNPRLTLIPNYQSAMLYDNKLEQAKALSRWMPRTYVFTTPGSARRFIDSTLFFPFISKSSEGASSHNVRFIQSYEEAKLEIKYAFSDIGIAGRYGARQRGYLIWQEFIEGNDYDIRVLAIGRQRLMLKRYNRSDRPMASGSGHNEPINALDGEAFEALQFANEFFREEKQTWSGIDLVRRGDGQWYMLECTVGWTVDGYKNCLFHGSNRKGSDIWKVLLEEIKAGVFKP